MGTDLYPVHVKRRDVIEKKNAKTMGKKPSLSKERVVSISSQAQGSNGEGEWQRGNCHGGEQVSLKPICYFKTVY